MFKYNVRNYPDNRGIKNFVFFLVFFNKLLINFFRKMTFGILKKNATLSPI